MIIPIYKQSTQTPLETIEALRKKGDRAQSEVASYAGRLDPMAEGLLLVLTGSDVDAQKDFENVDKTYIAEVVFGIGTDSHDILGIPVLAEKLPITESGIDAGLTSFVGEYETQVPLYSSVKVDGKALYWHARNNPTVVLPERTTQIYSITDILLNECRGEVLQLEAIEKVRALSGDFRQADIIDAWEQLPLADEKFITVQFTVSCASGTYIRSLARDLGEMFGTRAMLRSLIRIQVGEYTLLPRA